MKPYKIVLFLLLSIANSVAGATIWTVDNNPTSDAHFSQLSEAVASAQVVDGDTLYVRGSSVTYISFTLTKNIKIVGPGYFLADNSKTHNSKNSARISTIAFSNADFSSASGSSISGMEITAQLKLYEVSNILIEKNKIKQMFFLPGTTGIHNILIMQNYLGIQTSGVGYETFYSSSASFDGIIVANNIIKTLGTYTPMSYQFRQGSVNFYNNYFEGGSIYMPGLAVVYDNLFYNIYGSRDLGSSASNNLIVSSLSGVLDTDEQADHYNVLSTGSPAIGYGVTGGDVGISGGDRPYVLSGMPGIPSVYSIVSPGTVDINGSLPVTIGVKSH